MTIIQIQELLRDIVRQTTLANFGIELEQIVIETPPKTELGDLAFPVAFDLTKKIKIQTGEKRNPREVAETLKAALESVDYVERVDVAGAGYLNVFFDRVRFLKDNLVADSLPQLGLSDDAASPKVCVEHTSVNPNKAAHIGHVRNSVLGDTFQRILKATGKRVEVQNYIDNTGVQVADVVVGFMFIEHMSLDAIKALDNELKAGGTSFDYYCWDLYTRVGQEYQTNESLKQKRAKVLHLIEEGGNETADLADYVATRNVECILDTMNRLSIRYDLLPRESEILHLHFWEKAFEEMKRLGVIHFEAEGSHAGCWVMPFESHVGSDEHEADKILVRSNGTVTYTGKDIAYQMWKLGILGLDFHYRPFYQYDDGTRVWMTSERKTDESQDVPIFGGGETIYNVIDTRQSYPQEVVRKGVGAISPERGEQASVHLSYEMVALSPAAAEELGFQLSDDDRKRTFIEMSGRKGLGVKADDFIDRLEANALVRVEKRNAELSDDEKSKIAHQLAVGALRYFLLKFTRTTVIVFDFEEALSTEGETGCFCQYSGVRANKIFGKLKDQKGETIDQFRIQISQSESLKTFFASTAGSDAWSLIVMASRLQETANQSALQNEPAILAKYAFNLSKLFNLFYHNHNILNEPDNDLRALLAVAVDIARRSLIAALAALGIEVPERM